jgi:hypothetical protein
MKLVPSDKGFFLSLPFSHPTGFSGAKVFQVTQETITIPQFYNTLTYFLSFTLVRRGTRTS